MMMKSGLGKIFLKFLHALTMSFLLLNFDQKYRVEFVIYRVLKGGLTSETLSLWLQSPQTRANLLS